MNEAHVLVNHQTHGGITAHLERGEHINYREHHLRAPPRGYEWRMVDGNYVLAAVATGVIASVVAAEVAAH